MELKLKEEDYVLRLHEEEIDVWEEEEEEEEEEEVKHVVLPVVAMVIGQEIVIKDLEMLVLIVENQDIWHDNARKNVVIQEDHHVH